MFEKHREKKEQAAREKADADWAAERAAAAETLDYVQTYRGEPTSELVLKRGESLFAKIDQVSLIEDRRGPGQWQGRSQGVSIPVGSLGGRSIRYHVGGSHGHYVSGTPIPTAIDTGTLFVTNRRAVFRGQKQTRECLFDKLISCEHQDGETIFSVSNRQKNTVIHYGSQLNDWFEVRYALAFADYRGTTDELVADLKKHLAEVDARRPAPAIQESTSTPMQAAPTTEPAAPAPAAWLADPLKRHGLRYWDGSQWTEHVSDSGITSIDPP